MPSDTVSVLPWGAPPTCELSDTALLPYVCLAAVLSFLCAVGIGANDLAANFAMVVGSGSLSLSSAVKYCAFFEVLGAALMGGRVTGTLAHGIFDDVLIERHIPTAVAGMTAASFAATMWLFLSSHYGLPVSITHTVVGSLVGFAVFAGGGFSHVHGATIIKIVVSWVVAPLFAAVATVGLLWGVNRRLLLRRDAFLERLRREDGEAKASEGEARYLPVPSRTPKVGAAKPGTGGGGTTSGRGLSGRQAVLHEKRQRLRSFGGASVERLYVWLPLLVAATLAVNGVFILLEQPAVLQSVSFNVQLACIVFGILAITYAVTVGWLPKVRENALEHRGPFPWQFDMLKLARDHRSGGHHNHGDQHRGAGSGGAGDHGGFGSLGGGATSGGYRRTAALRAAGARPASSTRCRSASLRTTTGGSGSFNASSLGPSESLVLEEGGLASPPATLPVDVPGAPESGDDTSSTTSSTTGSEREPEVVARGVRFPVAGGAKPVVQPSRHSGRGATKRSKGRKDRPSASSSSSSSSSDSSSSSSSSSSDPAALRHTATATTVVEIDKQHLLQQSNTASSGRSRTPPPPSRRAHPRTHRPPRPLAHHHQASLSLNDAGPTGLQAYRRSEATALVPVVVGSGATTPGHHHKRRLSTAGNTDEQSPASVMSPLLSAKRPATATNSVAAWAGGNPWDTSHRAEYLFTALQLIAGAMSSFVHGAVAGANATGPFLVLYGVFVERVMIPNHPDYEKKNNSFEGEMVYDSGFASLLAVTGIAIGMSVLGARLVATVGAKLVLVTPAKGYAMQVGGTIVTMICTAIGVPVSLSQCQVGAAVGSGLYERWERKGRVVKDNSFNDGLEGAGRVAAAEAKDSVDWGLVAKLVAGWAMTLIVAGLSSGIGLHVLLHLMCGGQR